jgi:tetratricopeptide (TPR) repeat protein
MTEKRLFMNHPAERLLCIVSLILFSTAGSYSESTDWTAVHDLTVSGIRQLYSLEVDSAIETFHSVSRMAPGDPRGPFFQSMVHFYIYNLNRDEKELSTFLNESEKVIEICERLLDQDDRDTQSKFYLGGIYGYRGLAYQTSGSILKAARDGRKGYLLLEDAVRENPKLYDAQMGFGLFRYLLAKIPKSMRWILTVLGFEGDLEGGLTSLRLASEKGIYTRTEAKLFLSQFLFSEGRRDSALRYLNELRKEYPENTLFMVLYAAWQHRLHNLDEAMTAARAALDLNSRKKVRYGEELAYSTLGSIYFTLNDFANARTYYLLYMQLTRNNERTPNQTNLRAGLACEIEGDRATALEFYRRTREPDAQNRFWDRNNYRRGQELLRQPLTDAEILIIKGGNESSQKRYSRAIELFTEGFEKAGKNVDIQVRALYGLQQAQFEADSLAGAVATANRLLALNPVNEAWITPHAWFKLGQTYAKQSRIADARAAFSRVDDYDDYDFQERLEGQVEEERKKLER